MAFIKTKHLEELIVAKNKFINTSVQRGCMEKVPPVAKNIFYGLDNLPNLWLDIPNVYGSISHRFISFALKRYGVHKHWISFIKAYYSGIYSKLCSSPAPSSW